jgi:hypothetical protein
MNAKTNWNTQSKTDTVAFSALIAAGMLMAWFAAAAPIAELNADLNAAAAMSQVIVQPAHQANDPRIMVTASRLAKNNG